MDSTTIDPPQRPAPGAVSGLAGLIFFLACVEVASGAIQGYYTPLFKDIGAHLSVHDADLNWLEAAQLAFAALVVPPLARLGDLVGHRRVLLASTAVTAAASWGIAFAPGFSTMLVAWAIQGAYVIWLPLEVALIHRRTQGNPEQARLTRRTAAILVAVLDVSIIASALVAGALVDHLSMTTILCIPAVVVTLALPVIALGVPHVPGAASGGFGWASFGMLLVMVGLVMGGLISLRVAGPGSLLGWVLVVAGLVAAVPWSRLELASAAPLVDLRVIRHPGQWPIQVAAFLLGITILGAQVPLSVYARTDPDVAGFGLGLTAAEGSGRIAGYVLCLAIGALLLPLVARAVGLWIAMAASFAASAAGYAAWFAVHDSAPVTLLWLVLTGLGSGGLVAAIPAGAVAAAPPASVGIAAGASNASKLMGGALAAAVFAICLTPHGSISIRAGEATLGGYHAVWGICAVAGLVGAVLMLAARRSAAAVSVGRT
ncbi:MFS transporter [Nocardioides sp. TF02-7]|uniref:MFS transporter n=1 Tax=Nocardioides sp. TF02-7 TaxID=2917724 RepID=UPI001F050E39|nr:MFS transporter [Nocardioides sp. TF02-7]UMG94446.1 MFS transporter [Nocardioides sp. TF02-7]